MKQDHSIQTSQRKYASEILKRFGLNNRYTKTTSATNKQ